MNSVPYPAQNNGYLVEHTDLMMQSFYSLIGKHLLGSKMTAEIAAQQLFDAPFALLSHNTNSDPLFNYANKTALALFEMDWSILIKTPSRKSAELVNRKERVRLLDKVTENGYINDYQGIRISSSGKRFMIKQAVVWNLIDSEDNYYGQAAYFNHWEFLNSKN